MHEWEKIRPITPEHLIRAFVAEFSTGLVRTPLGPLEFELAVRRSPFAAGDAGRVGGFLDP